MSAASNIVVTNKDRVILNSKPNVKEVMLTRDQNFTVGGGVKITFKADTVVSIDINTNIAYMEADNGEYYHIELETDDFKHFS